MASYNLITSEEFNRRCEEGERSGRFYIEMREAIEGGAISFEGQGRNKYGR